MRLLTSIITNVYDEHKCYRRSVGNQCSGSSEYRLDADDAKLTPHVGHKVEITGTAEAAGMAQRPATSRASAPKLKVDSVKMIAATCP